MSVDGILSHAGDGSAQRRRQRSPWLFFALVFLLSVPFALLGFVTKLQLMPGIPISALGFVCPATAAALLSYREHGRAGVSALFEDLLNSSDLS